MDVIGNGMTLVGPPFIPNAKVLVDRILHVAFIAQAFPSFGVTLVFTRVQEPPGTEVHGPGPAGVLLREENHLGRVQPVTGIQLAPLQQDEAAPISDQVLRDV